MSSTTSGPGLAICAFVIIGGAVLVDVGLKKLGFSGFIPETQHIEENVIEENVILEDTHKAEEAQRPKEESFFTVRYVNSSDGTLNLRASPSADAEILASLPQGTAVYIYGRDNPDQWAKARYNSMDGFVNQRFLSDAKPEEQKTAEKMQENATDLEGKSGGAPSGKPTKEEKRQAKQERKDAKKAAKADRK